MIKWFCDVCGLEIVAPEHPVCVRVDRAGKNRDDADIGWGESDEIVRVFAHKSCADALEHALKDALAAVKEQPKKRTPQT